jgi:hypothetical protein
VTKLSELGKLANRSPEEISSFLDQQLTAERIASWAEGNAERLEQLRRIVGESDGSATDSIPGAIAALEGLEDLDEEVISALAGLLGPGMDRDARLALLRALTEDSAGRKDAGEIMGQRAGQRMGDARRATSEFTALIEDPSAGETELQNFIEDNIWLLGMHYVEMRPRQPTIRGELDLILERYDGFHDLLELKDPQDHIVEAPDTEPPPPANKYKLSTALSKALAQVHIYRHTLTEYAPANEGLFGLPHTRDPRILIVVGRADTLTEHRADVLRELNKSLHRVEIVPYDILAKRATAILDSVEKYLTVSASATEDLAA